MKKLASCENEKQCSEKIAWKLNEIISEASCTVCDEHRIDVPSMNKITSKIKAQEYPNIHSVLIVKNGELVYEKYFQGRDQIFGKDIGVIQHSVNTLHDVRSITKSVVSACVGIALDKGLIKSVDQKVAFFFPELKSVFTGEKINWTIRDFLTMTTGIEWKEDVPYDHAENGEYQMTHSEVPVEYVLSRPLGSAPGEKFNYNGGTTQVLAKIIERVSSTRLDQFATENLFGPLGIERFEWSKYSVWEGSDEFAASSGLRLTSQDLMKIGLLYRNKGYWKGDQIISAEWVKESFTQRVKFPSAVTKGNDAYGYQFWMWAELMLDIPFKMIAARGNGGQNIYWDLKNDIIVVTTAGNYNDWDVKKDPYVLLRDEIYPLILDKEA